MRPMQVGSGKRSGTTSNDEGSLDLYLREISRYPLINQEEEVTLAQRIRKGEEEALDKLVRSNLRFVVSVAKKYQNQGVSLSDLINEGKLTRVKVGGCSLITWESAQALIKVQGEADDAPPQR